MSWIHRSQAVVFSIGAVVALALVSPMAVRAEEPAMVVAPVPAPAWETTSGYAAVEANRVLAAHQALLAGNLGSLQEERLLAVAAVPSWDATSGYAAVEASRVVTTNHGVLTDDAPWDVTSGYGVVETSRAVAAVPELAPLLSQVPSDVRWAPMPTLYGVLTPLATTALAWDETSGYGAVESARTGR